VTLTSYLLGIIGALLVIAVVVELLRRGSLRERHAVWWLIAGLLALIAAIFPGAVVWVAGLIGIEVPINLVFFVSIAILFLVCLQLSAEVTRLESKTRTLAERVALIELEVRKSRSHDTADDEGSPTRGPAQTGSARTAGRAPARSSGRDRPTGTGEEGS